MNHFARALSLSFFVALFLFVLPTNKILSHLLNKVSHITPEQSCSVDFNIPYLDMAINSPLQAKSHHTLWADFLGARHCGKDGFGFDILNDRRLFSEVFPGYEKDLFDNKNMYMFFWRTYFSRVFNFDTWPSYQPFTNSLRVSASWQGNADIFKNHGADIITVGSSQTFRQIIPQELSKHLQNFWHEKYGHDPKILMLTVSNMQMDTIDFLARKLSPSQEKAKLAILGYTPKMAFLNSPDLDQANKSRQREWQDDRFRTHFELKDYVPYSDWKAVFPIDLFDIKAALRPGANGLPSFTSDELKNNADSFMEESLAHYKPAPGTVFFNEFESFTSNDCQVEPLVKDLQKTVQSLLKISEQVFLYIPPSSPIAKLGYQNCFDESIKIAMQTLSSDQVIVSTVDWGHYNLNHSDYLWPNANPQMHTYDPIHTNFDGAQKVTKVLAKLIADPSAH